MLSKKQLEAIDLLVDDNLMQKEVANIIGVSEQTICNWKKNDEFLTELERNIRMAIKNTAIKAYRTVGKLMDGSQNDFVRLNAAKDILDRAGYKPVEKQEVKADVNNKVDLSNMSTEEIKELLNEQ